MTNDLIQATKFVFLLLLRMLNDKNAIAFFDALPGGYSTDSITLFILKIIAVRRAMIGVVAVHTDILIIDNKDIIGTAISILKH
ncbi:hypothetical protein D3C81_1447050 [compost metagenome]